VEVTDTQHYDAWLRERWDVERAARANESRKFIVRAQIRPDDNKFIDSITADDRELYALLSKQIDASGQHAIMGRDLAGIERFN
jgi:hypothetical protein